MKERLKKIKEALELLPDEQDGWWCPQCQSEVDATFHEDCHTCGFYIGDCQPDQGTTKKKKEALEQLEELQKESQWQPIETAPRDGTEIIITNGCDTCTGKYYPSVVQNYAPFFAQSVDGELRNEGFDYKVEPVYFYEPTHWMPLPQPPKKD